VRRFGYFAVGRHQALSAQLTAEAVAWICLGVPSATSSLSNVKIIFGLSIIGHKTKPQLHPHDFRGQWRKIVSWIQSHPNVLKDIKDAVHEKLEVAAIEKKAWIDEMGDIPSDSEEE
jgi:hypothetical protein